MGALFSLTYNFSGLFAPIIGGLLFDYMSTNQITSYRKTMDVNMIFELVMAIIFFIFNCGFKVFQENEQLNSDISNMQTLTKMVEEIDEVDEEERTGVDKNSTSDINQTKNTIDGSSSSGLFETDVKFDERKKY